MKFACRSCLLLLLLFLSCTVSIPSRAADTPAAAPSEAALKAPPPRPYSKFTYPEIVRLAYAEGDVRIERGEKKDAGWQQAVSGLPLFSGSSLVTGPTGRAEIELEDASTLYLDSNSVLVLNDLHTSAGIPYTEVSLLTGTLSMHVRPYVEREQFLLETPTDHLFVNYGHLADFRVTSYTNAMAITPLKDAVLILPGAAEDAVNQGQTFYFNHGIRMFEGGLLQAEDEIPAAKPDPQPKTDEDATNPVPVAAPASPASSNAFASFDQWVAARETARHAAMEEAMNASGLKEPIPGLEALAGQGQFFACPPYGTCWSPPAVAAAKPQPTLTEASYTAQASAHPASTAVDAQSAAPTLGPPAPGQPPVQAPRKSGYSSQSGSAAPLNLPIAGYPFEDAMDFFPCMPDAMLYQFGMYPYGAAFDPMAWGFGSGLGSPYGLGYGSGYGFGYEPYAMPWARAVCHAGEGWLYNRQRKRYVWVVGPRRWHKPPIRWVKTGRTLGFVPLHPRDISGKLPVNRVHGIYTLTTRPTGKSPVIERVALEPGADPHLLKDPPKQYRSIFFAPLPRATDPSLEARRVDFTLGTGPRAVPAKGTDLSFDRRSQTFMMARQVNVGGHMRTVSMPVSNSFAGRLSGRVAGGFHASGSGGGFAGRAGGYSSGGLNGGAARGGGSFNGGAARGGGGFSGGGSSAGGGFSGGGGRSEGGGGGFSGGAASGGGGGGKH